jgi:ferredoxin
MKVAVDADVCGGFGTCVTKAPRVFELTDAGYAVVILPEVPEELETAVQDAVDLCPTHAITITPT